MSALRVASATWFELLTAREELAPTLRSLADTGQVELEAHSDVAARQLLPPLRAMSDEYRRLVQQYGEFWPAVAATTAEQVSGEIEAAGREALKRLRAWAAEADPLIARVQQLAAGRTNLEFARDLLRAVPAPTGLPNLAWLAEAGPVLATRTYCLTDDAHGLAVPVGVMTQRVGAGGRLFLIAVGRSDAIQAFDETLSALAARRFTLPVSLPADPQAALAELDLRLARSLAESAERTSRLAELSAAHGVSEARADLAFIDWLVEHVPELTMTEHLAWITGWTTDATGAVIRTALTRARLHFLLRFPGPPGGIPGPVVFRNPPWIRPFELFARLLGVPQPSEADPSAILAVVAPLLFGFMFGDVAQGVALVAAGLLLRKRYPTLALLIPGGVAAIAFGFLFGSIFARDDLLPALWVRPLAHPIALLRASLALGSTLILLGLALDAVQYHWAGEMRRWWTTRAGLAFAYLGVVASMLDLRALWALPLGLLGCCLAPAAQAPRQRWKAAGDAAGGAVEALLQLLVNTLSFVRVGAFALAHAGLASAVVALAASVHWRPLAGAMLLLGNGMMVVIETLVVGIQTTRLVLFEFFIRFMHGAGRPFRPLLNPDISRSAR